MRFILALALLISQCCLAQTWAELKATLKSESEKNKRAVQSARVRNPVSFSDNGNHFLMNSVHPSGKPIYLTTLNSNAAQTTGASLLQSGAIGFTLSGSEKHIFQWDAGAVFNHQEFDTRVFTNEGTSDRHATHVAGTLIASGVNPLAKGMAPLANLHAYYFEDDIFKIAVQSELNTYGFMISNHSYGVSTGWHRVGGGWEWMGDETVSVNEDFTAGLYSVRSQRIDQIAEHSPYHTIVWAAGNDRADVGDGSHPQDCNGGSGYDCIIQEGTAKNIITVGAVDQVLNYSNASSVVMSTFSSWGPTDDGRIKPDLVSDGVSVFSASNTGIDQYVTLGGTSMATPTVAGSLLLLQDLYGKLNGNRWMRASTLKALAIHTAREAGNAPGPDYSFGWGLIDVAEAARVISKRDDVNTYIIEGELLNDDIHEWVLNPQPNQKITATVVWTDPAGLSPGAILDPPYKMLVNDLDLELADNNGVVQLPWKLDPQNPALAATHGDNVRDNVEKIEFTPTETKPLTLRLSHKGFLLNESQHYSIIITYTSTSTSRPMYWVGGDGNWNDAFHWSFSSGGSFAGRIPGVDDIVIVDDNSFPNTGEIHLTSSVSVRRLRWICSRDAGIDFNNKVLTITNAIALASNAFRKVGNGKFRLAGSLNNYLMGTSDFAQRPDFEFVSGSWSVRGNVYVDSLILSGGSVYLDSTQVTANHFVSMTPITGFYSRGSSMEIEDTWKTGPVQFLTTNTRLVINNPANMQAQNTVWHGVLVNEGALSLDGKLTVDSLSLVQGSTLQLTNSSTLSVLDGVNISGTTQMPVNINSIGSASIDAVFHRKICTDFVHISNVNLTGVAVVNLNSNSSIQNASGWIQQTCDEILFPDFSVQYGCAGALTEFKNESQGEATLFHWNFGDLNSDTNESDQQSPYHQYVDVGDYLVTLTVSKGTITQSYSRTVTISINTLPVTSIAYNAEKLFSTSEADRYQWFLNDQPILNERERSFNYGGAEGFYRVVLYDKQCNSPSDEFSVSGVGQNEPNLVFPNPTNGKVAFITKDIVRVDLFDLRGSSIAIRWDPSQEYLDLSDLNDGVFILMLTGKKQAWIQKIWVRK